MIDWNNLINPILDLEPGESVRDPAVIYHEGIFRCFFTCVQSKPGGFSLTLDSVESTDLIKWVNHKKLAVSALNFSSPGNVFKHNGKWYLCLQSYPIDHGEKYGNESSRLWLMESDNLIDWTEPRMIKPDGCTARWTESHRQIDPYVLQHDGRFWCFYKTDGSIGLLVSEDLEEWHQADMDKPVISAGSTPEGATVENPCVIKTGNEFTMFFSPCREGRGIGTARSTNLTDWYDIKYLDLPGLNWAPGGPTAAMVLDLEQKYDRWVMFFHGERQGPHGAALGAAWSRDLQTWICK